MKFLNELKLNGKRVLFRFDYNVPLNKNGQIIDDLRIKETIPSINYALKKKAKIIIISHLGRPKGIISKKYSLLPVCKKLSKLLNQNIIMLNNCIGNDILHKTLTMKNRDIIMLENLRFHKEEEENNKEFALQLASYADIYIDDAFGNAHRAHASNFAIVKYVKSCGLGFLMKKELHYLNKAFKNPSRPFVAIIGGSKISSKLAIMINLLQIVDKLIIGGGMAFTFLKVQGYEIGKSLLEKEFLNKAKEILELAKILNVKIYLPVDCIVASNFSNNSKIKIVSIQNIASNLIGLDIGPITISLFTKMLTNAKTIIWNGPMGVCEIDTFSKGTTAIIKSIAKSLALSIVGGGDTNMAIRQIEESKNISYISTGGGAFLELLTGKELPAIKAIKDFF